MLVVDDYRGITNALCRHIRVLGHDARGVYTGRDGLAEAAAWQPDLVLVDLLLPDLTGYEVAKKLRTYERPMYLASISTRSGIDNSFFDTHVQKPFGLTHLSALISQMTTRPQSS